MEIRSESKDGKMGVSGVQCGNMVCSGEVRKNKIKLKKK